MIARLFLPLSLLALCIAPSGAGAATFVVDNLADANDASPGNGVCDNGDGTCSFRAAVQEANALAGPDRLELVTGTHELTLSSSFGLLKPSLQTEIEVVGAGVGQTIIFSDVKPQNAMMDVVLAPGENVTISKLTIDVQTGQHAFEYVDTGLIPPSGLLLEDIELLGNSTVPPNCCGAGTLLTATGSGQITLRRAFVQTQRDAANGWIIQAQTTGGLVIEDSIFDGGNQYRIAVLQNLTTSSSGPVTVRDSTFRNFGGPAGIFGSGDAVIRMRLFNKPGATVIERSTFENSFQAINVVNEGFDADVTITESLFTNIDSVVRASGPATLTMTNSTISGGGTGIALVAPASGSGLVDMALTSSTITGASTSVSVGSGTGSLSAQNSIIANGTTECVGTLTSAGYNLVEGTCTIAGDTTGNLTGVDPQLDALFDNGGPTLTHALNAGSPAIDAGSAGDCPATDQRGFSRPADGDGDTTAVCDIGAFEKDAVLVINQPPTAADDTATVDEDSAVAIDVADNDSDPDGNLDPTSTNIACGACSGTANGALVNNIDGTFDYTPEPDFFGADAFVYEICDSDSACDTASVNIMIEPVNDPPTFTAGDSPSFAAGTSGAQSVPAWPHNVDLGPNEVQQIDSYTVTITADPDTVLSGPVTLSNGGTLAFTLSGAGGVAELEATLKDDGGSANGGSDTSAPVPFLVTVGDSLADLVASSIRCSAHAAPDEPYAYSIVITNNGPDPVAGVMATHEPIPGATVNSVSSLDCVVNGSIVDCDLGVLAAGAVAQVGLEIQAPDVGAQALTMSTETATTSTTDDPNLVNNLDNKPVLIVPGLIKLDAFQACLPVEG